MLNANAVQRRLTREWPTTVTVLVPYFAKAILTAARIYVAVLPRGASVLQSKISTEVCNSLGVLLRKTAVNRYVVPDAGEQKRVKGSLYERSIRDYGHAG